MSRVLGLLVVLLSSAAAPAVAACDQSNPSFICGLNNAEDLVRLTETPWVIASHLNISFSGSDVSYGFGPVEAIRIDTHEVHRLYPTPDATFDWDRNTFPDCPAPPESLDSHGLNVRSLGNQKFRLYVANHGGRQSVEVIDIEAGGQRLLTAWRGCIRAPEGIWPNALVPLPDDGVALSGGQVAIWYPGRAWVGIEGIKGGNGIEISRDGQSLFVVDGLDVRTPRSRVVRVPVKGGAVQTVSKFDFNADNLRWGEDGDLYVAGQLQVMECLKTLICDVGFVVARIDPMTLATREIFRSNGIKGSFGAATTALQVGTRFWIGSWRADRVAILAISQ
jgi:hypothetical protein